MSRIKDIQQKALSYVKRINIEREEYKFINQKDGDGSLDTQVQSEISKCDPIDHQLGVANSFLVDHNLLKPLTFRINRIVLVYSALFVWALLVLADDNRVRWFLFGGLVTLIFFACWVLWLYTGAQSQIDYRKALLDYYSNELERMYRVKPTDSFRFDSASRKRKGWVYLTERYDKTTFRSSDLVLAYAILQKGTLQLYVIDEKCVLKPRLPLDAFNNLLKKMHCNKKLAFDVSELEVKLVPDDLTMGRAWNRKFPIRLTATKDVLCVLDVEAPVASFVDFLDSCSEPFVVPSYHRSTTLRLDGTTIYLFGVSAREKERWYYKLVANCDETPVPDLTEYARSSERSNFNAYIEDAASKGQYVGEKVNTCMREGSSEECQASSLMAVSMFSLNVIFTRLFWDFWREQSWNSRVLGRLQRVLDRLLLPPWLKFLRAEDLNMGDTLPLLFSAEAPIMDEDGGFWVNCPFQYHGKFSVTIHTQIHHDLYGVFTDKGELETSDVDRINSKTNEDLLSSMEFEATQLTRSSSHSGYTLSGDPEVRILREGTPFERKGASKIKHSVVKILQGNKEAFKTKAIDYAKKLCKSAANHIENSNLSLLLRVTDLKGTLSIYFPPPPTNRVWFGFRGMPALNIHTKPKIGTRHSVKFPIITQWIEKRLKDEFKEILVIPSMVDLYLPFLSSGLSFPVQPH